MHRELTQTGNLKTVLERRATAALDSYHQAMAQAYDERADLDLTSRPEQSQAARRSAVEVAIARGSAVPARAGGARD